MPNSHCIYYIGKQDKPDIYLLNESLSGKLNTKSCKFVEF